MRDSLQWCRNALIKLHEWVQKRWMFVSIFLSTSSIWFSLILSFCGERLNLIVSVNGKRQLTLIGWILTIIVVGFSCLLAMAQRYYEYKKLNSDSDKRKLYILEQVDMGTNKICDNKFITLKKQIVSIKNNNTSIPQIVSKPCEQLKHITEKMSSCLRQLLSQNDYTIKEDELYVSLYYNFPLENNIWKLADSLSPEKGLSIEELLREKTTFKKVLSSKETFLFFNSKEQARRNECYIRDSEDGLNENGELKGSIACYRIKIKENNQVLINAVLSITTYDKKFINSDDRAIIENTKYNINEYILKPFIKRIDIELCLLYLFTLHESRKHNVV